MNIVFILGNSVNQNGIKRIDEFFSRGYKVSAYGFHRNIKVDILQKNVKMNIVGSFNNDMPYKNRIGIISRGIKQVIKNTKNEKPIYYLIGSDIGLVFSFISSNPFIYEEADLVHTYINNKVIRSVFKYLDKRVIRKSILTVFRSEGFIRYYFKSKCPNNVTFIANRLNVNLLDYKSLEKPKLDLEHLKFGFAGAIRFQSIYNFAHTLLKNFPQHEFHFYGIPSSEKDGLLFKELEAYKNCFFHGPFKNPADLPLVYNNMDLVLSTYDVEFDNVRYAEPNKLYESIYFETPIIVSSGTFLAEKVKRLGVGYEIDAMDTDTICNFVSNLTEDSIKDKQLKAASIDKYELVNINDKFFDKLNSIIESL